MLNAALPYRPVEIGRSRVSEHWCLTRDGDPQAVELFRRHYSCQDPAKKLLGGNYSRFAGQGQPLVLIDTEAQALFVWRKEAFRLDDQSGVCCSVFRNEGPVRSSDLIREAMVLAWERWPGERLFTFVDETKIRPCSMPGRCFKKAGWTYQKVWYPPEKRWRRARTKQHRLLILEMLP